MKNENIHCQHCHTLIGKKHVMDDSFHPQGIVVPLKKGRIVKVSVQGSSHTERYGDMATTYEMNLKTKLQCLSCEKHTTLISKIDV